MNAEHGHDRKMGHRELIRHVQTPHRVGSTIKQLADSGLSEWTTHELESAHDEWHLDGAHVAAGKASEGEPRG